MLAFMSMNRQLRRAQEKQEKKVEKEKEERRAERRRRLDQLRAQRQRKAAAKSGTASRSQPAGKQVEAGAKPAAKPGRNDPGRFAGALAIATIVFIVLQAVVPSETEGTFDSVIKAGFYLMLGYFLTLWLLRRQQPNALILSGLAGIILLTGTWLGFLLRPDAALDGLAMLMALPLLVFGIWLGRLVYNMARSQNLT